MKLYKGTIGVNISDIDQRVPKANNAIFAN